MNKYIKIKGWENYSLVVDETFMNFTSLSEQKSEEILRKHVVELHSPTHKLDTTRRLILAATRNLDYKALHDKYGTLYVQPNGSFCIPYDGLEISDEMYSEHFPIGEYADILICENDSYCQFEWLEYLKNIPEFKSLSIKTIPFFDISDESMVSEYFTNCKVVTFSTTFTNLEWFKKLTRNLQPHNKVLGHCVIENFDYTEVNKINKDVTYIMDLKMHNKELYKFKF